MASKIGSGILFVSFGVTAYAAVAFFLITGLPPNSATGGRLPSLFLMFGGMAGMLLGTAVRGLCRRADSE